MTPKAFARLADPLLGDGKKKQRHAVLAAGGKTDKYLKDLRKTPGVKFSNSPRFAVTPLQTCSMSIIERTTYVSDFKPQFDAQGKVQAVNPVVGMVQDGTSVQCTCGFLSKQIVGIDIHATVAELEKPIPKVKVQVAGCKDVVELGVPKLEAAEVRAAVRVPLGGVAMFLLPSTKAKIVAFVQINELQPAKAGK